VGAPRRALQLLRLPSEMLTLTLIGALLNLAAAQVGCNDLSVCATGPVDTTKEIGHTCVTADGLLYGNTLDPACAGGTCVDASNPILTAELCTPPKIWLPTTCSSMQAGTPTVQCSFLLPFVLTPQGIDCCYPPPPLCDATQLQGVIGTMSGACQALLGGALSTGGTLEDEAVCPCFLEVDETVASTNLKCLYQSSDEATLYESYERCAASPLPSSSPSPSPSPSPSNACADLKAAYKASECCGADKDKSLYTSTSSLSTCGEVKFEYKVLSCCPKATRK